MEAARDVLVAEGLVGVNIDAIASRAGVAVGTIYQFFPSKEAVLNELGRRTLMSARQTLRLFSSTDADTRPWTKRLGSLVDALAQTWSQDTSTVVIWDPRWTTSEMRKSAEAFDAEVEGMVARILVDAGVPRNRIMPMAAVMVQSSNSVLDRWTRDGAEQLRVLRELKSMLTAYVASSICR